MRTFRSFRLERYQGTRIENYRPRTARAHASSFAVGGPFSAFISDSSSGEILATRLFLHRGVDPRTHGLGSASPDLSLGLGQNLAPDGDRHPRLLHTKIIRRMRQPASLSTYHAPRLWVKRTGSAMAFALPTHRPPQRLDLRRLVARRIERSRLVQILEARLPLLLAAGFSGFAPEGDRALGGRLGSRWRGDGRG